MPEAPFRNPGFDGKYTRSEFARHFLRGIDAPADDKKNLYAMVAWMQAEGWAGKFNPLNSTQPWPGSTDFNAVPVQNYQSFEDGVGATVKTLNYGADHKLYGYARIRHCFRNRVNPALTLEAVEDSAWGTGGLASRCLKQVKDDWSLYRALPIRSN